EDARAAALTGRPDPSNINALHLSAWRLSPLFDRDNRDFGPAELLRRQNPAVARDNALLCIDQHRHVEAETLDAIGDLPHLFAAMQPRVLWIKPQCDNRFVTDG